MENASCTILACSNLELIQAYAKDLQDDTDEGKKIRPTFKVETSASRPHWKMLQLSEQFPDEDFYCRYDFPWDGLGNALMLKYRIGRCKAIEDLGQWNFYIPD